MKVMDVSIEEKNSTIEIVTPQRKKMKQALLPYQMISPLGSPSAIKNKKRKLDSPSPVEPKSPRSGKRVKKQNTPDSAKEEEVEVIDLSPTDDDEEVGQKSSTTKIIRENKDSKESNEEQVAKGDEKIEKESETEMKKKRDYSVLDMFLKKAQSRESKDDIQLLAMSDYESGNSKDSDASSKMKLDAQSAKKTSEEILLKELNNETGKENKDVELGMCQSDAKTEQDSDAKTANKENKENEAVPLEIQVPDADANCEKKESVSSDDNDVKTVDSDSDIEVLSSDEDGDDEPDKSSNENEKEKDKTSEKNDSSKTPRSEKSKALKNKKLTPKQIERRLENAKKREEKLRLKQEKEQKREEERENRRKEKEQKRKEKEMKELKKQVETEQRQKEKEAKEEERRKREEEKLEAERKKQKAASNFANFFVAKKQETKPAEEESVVKDQNFMPFEVKIDMRVAPVTRRSLNNQCKLTFDGLFNKEVSPKKLYLDELKLNRGAVGRSEKTWPYETKDDVVIIDEDDASSDAIAPGNAPVTEKHHPKLFMFAENRRPPFWGTWRKKSDHISPRRPFAKDSKWFDYDVDSDDEWEEEEPGESIRGSDDERDEEGPEDNEYDVDNDFMVPHGYLSDEEAKADEEDGEDMSPETQKLKLKLLGEQFEAERKTKTSRIKPKVIGCVWQGAVNSYPENTPNVVQILMARRAWVREIPIILSVGSSSVSEIVPTGTSECAIPAPHTAGAKKKLVPEEAIPNLIRLVHGNINGRIFLIKEFMAFWEKNKTGDRQISKLSLSRKIKEIARWMACPDEGPMHLRSCWYVKEEVRKQYNCLDVTVPNRWEYTLRPTRRSDVTEIDKPEKIEKEKKRIPLITQFTKKITQQEMRKQLVSNSNAPQSKPHKRVALISVPRGEHFPQSNFLSKIVDEKILEKEGCQLIPVIAKLRESLSVDNSDGEKPDTTIDGGEKSSGARIVDEISHEVENTEVTNEKEVAECSKSTADGEEVNKAKSDRGSPPAEPMETEDVLILDD